jgi:tRNA-Thr(GGU) m(6)t(6)A37 methyltransferase TsaA
MKPITFISTPFKEKFGVPRQSLLVEEAIGVMTFPKDDFHFEAFRGIEESSHLWLIFEFHLIPDGEFNGLVRPPRFENKKKMGVFATRTPHRPNRLGLSVVKFEKIVYLDNEIKLYVLGVDLVDGTPIFDIKPYVPYVDAIAAVSPFNMRPELKPVIWKCNKVSSAASLIEKVISLDPRPGQDRNSEKDYGVSVAGFNVRFSMRENQFEILSVEKAN